MNIRLAINNDLEEICKLYKAVIDDLKNIKKIDMLWNDTYPFCELNNDISNKAMYVIENKNKIVGCFALNKYDNTEYQNIKWTLNKNKFFYLNRLAILPTEQGKGYAKEAMKFIQDYALNNKYDVIRLTVYSENKWAINLYEKCGFNKVKNGYYQLEDKKYIGYEKLIKNKNNFKEINKQLNTELVKYIENEVFSLYSRNEEGHGIKHIKTVIKRSLKFANEYNANLDMAYTIAAYHDIGHYIDRKRHEIISAEIFMKDEKIKQWFTDEQRNIIKEAIEDHRASSNHKPRSIYGMIVSTADRTIIDIDNTIKRSYSYGKRNYIGLSEEEQIERVYQHLSEKYGEDGYAKVYLEDKEFDKAIQKLRQALSSKDEFIERVKRVISQ